MGAPKAGRFMSRTIEDFTSKLSRRRSPNGDEENLTPGRFGRRGWLGRDLHESDLPPMYKTITVFDEDRGAGAGAGKLGTFSGVWVPTTLNVLSILMFLRFGFILGQCGVLGMLGMLVVSYLINLITTLSVSAISSNGTVRGGGAYYLISRSLGPEFGGSIGLVFYMGFVLNTGMNAVGMIDCIINNFGQDTGSMAQVMPESFWYRYLYATAVLVFCTVICLLGSAIFARASNLLLAMLLLSTFSIPFSTFLRSPFSDPTSGTVYTGISMQTLKENLMPRFTKGSAGSGISETENWQDLFGILFPATAGIFAGASMSGDLKNPSKAIPAGTLYSLLFTFATYALVILSMGAAIGRETLYTNINVVQDINLSPHLVMMGEFATCFFSALMGVIGSAKALQALARDNIFPGLSPFAKGSNSSDEPHIAIIFTFLLSQLTLLMDINTIASLVTMTYLITFWVTNLATFLLKVGSAPNFRPTFKFFTWWTAAAGAVISVVVMFFVDGFYASGVVGTMLALFLIIHYTTPPKSWGDVSQSLIYHQVRKYLLRLRQEHVKFWRPQILLFVNDPRRSWKLIQFCNAMKKGGLYVLGHIIVTTDFLESFPEVKKQQSAWMKYIDFLRIKAFPQVSISPTVEWGARNIVLSAGLGGLKPNVCVLGAFNILDYEKSRPLIDLQTPTSRSPGDSEHSRDDAVDPQEQLPTDSMRPEKSVSPMSYVNILEDILFCLQMNLTIAKGFNDLELPTRGECGKTYIDLWPIQMSAAIEDSSPDSKGSIVTTNFDTYALILQLGCVLHTVPAWKRSLKLRVVVFVEYETDVEEENRRVRKLLDNLRIQAEVLVLWLASGDLHSYNAIVNGAPTSNEPWVESALGDEQWWRELCNRRSMWKRPGTAVQMRNVPPLVGSSAWPSSSFQQLGGAEVVPMKRRVKKILKKAARRHSFSGHAILNIPASLNVGTQSLHSENVEGATSEDDSSEDDSIASSTASEDDLAEYSDDERGSSPKRRASAGDALAAWKVGGLKRQTRETAGLQERASFDTDTIDPSAGPSSSKPSPSIGRLPLPSRPSFPNFSCSAIPDTHISRSDGAGPSITFADTGMEGRRFEPSASRHSIESMQSLSFNDLPSKGQHLILNELMKKHSHDTAVLFTTLPSPSPGTCKSEQDSLDYLSDLEVLTSGLPPALLVHSNHVSVVTTAL